MALSYFAKTIRDRAGNVMASADVAVCPTGITTAATIYSDSAGAVPITSPATDSDGMIEFYVTTGTYDLAITDGNFSATITGVVIDAVYMSDLNSVANGRGAALVSIEDAGGKFTGTTVEAALQEVGTAAGTYLLKASNLSDVASAATSRTNLGLAIGTNVQAWDADLDAIAALTSAANKVPYATAAQTWALADFTAAGRALVDDADASAQRTTLGLGTMATQAASAVAITGGSVINITDLAVADGGTGASTAANARTNLGVVIGTDVEAHDTTLTQFAAVAWSAGTQIPVLTAADTFSLKTIGQASGNILDKAAGDALYQPLDSDLTTIAGLTATTNNFVQSSGSAWASRTPTQATATLIAMVGDSGSGGTKGLVPAPGAGDAAAGKFLKADGTFAVPSGSAAPTSLALIADATTTVNTATNTNLAFAVAANTYYAFTATLILSPAVAGGTKFAISGPAGALPLVGATGVTTATGNVVMDSITALATLTTAFSTSLAGAVRISGGISVAGTAGTITLQFASGTNGNTSTIKAGSVLTYQTATGV